jgi:tRNA(Ser,Leu) C12 N-acetylase TAN1
MKLTDVVDREKIDLKKPEKIIKVEVIGSNAAISVLNPDEQLIVS